MDVLIAHLSFAAHHDDVILEGALAVHIGPFHCVETSLQKKHTKRKNVDEAKLLKRRKQKDAHILIQLTNFNSAH